MYDRVKACASSPMIVSYAIPTRIYYTKVEEAKVTVAYWQYCAWLLIAFIGEKISTVRIVDVEATRIWTDGGINGSTDGRTDGWTDELTDPFIVARGRMIYLLNEKRRKLEKK